LTFPDDDEYLSWDLSGKRDIHKKLKMHGLQIQRGAVFKVSTQAHGPDGDEFVEKKFGVTDIERLRVTFLKTGVEDMTDCI
jgi:hypothetical protein